MLVCADEEKVRKDYEMSPDAETHLRACLRVPFSLRGWRRVAASGVDRLRLPLWNKSPDQYNSWRRGALKAVEDYARDDGYAPGVLVSFAQPMSDHLVGLALKKRYRVPWVAHFSDPWVGNAFAPYEHDPLTKARNLSLERRVIGSADRLVFTSQETVEMVMAKYPAGWATKARVLPQCYDADLFPARPVNDDPGSGLTVRYTGEFYGRRTPRPLVSALKALLSTKPALLSDVRFELIGDVEPRARVDSELSSLPEGLVVVKPAVDYRASLRLMRAADGLLVVDAPAEKSVFLPSKLIEYAGAGRPILGLTPPGAAASLIEQLGGWVAGPSDTSAMTRTVEDFLLFLRRPENRGGAEWGAPEVRRRYEAATVAGAFEAIIDELLSESRRAVV